MSDTHANAGSTASSRQTTSDDQKGADTTLVDILVAIGERKYFVFGVMLAAAVLGAAGSLLMPPVYVGQTVIMPPQQNRSGVAALAGLSALAGGIGDAIGVKTPDEIYVGLLQSDAVANDLVAQFKLKDRYRVQLTSDARAILRSQVHVTSDKKTGFITVAASDKSPEFAANLANAYIVELRKMLDRLAVTDAQQRRLFFQQQINQTLNRLSQAQTTFDQARRKSGVVSLDEQVSTTIRASAELKAKIAAAEVQLQTMQTYATAENPQMQRTLAEIEAMRGQLNTLEQGDEAMGKKDPSSNDSAALANIRAYREVKYQEAILDQLRQQLELAQVDEAREGPLVQQVDVAVPPDRKSAPRRSVIVLAAAALGGMVGICLALIRAGFHSRGQLAGQLTRIRQAWRLRRIA